MRHHDCAAKCVRAENLITEIGTQLVALKAKLRKKNVLIGEYEKTIATQKRDLRHCRETLDKLSRLGNEPLHGNSDGNIIAHKCLSELENPS